MDKLYLWLNLGTIAFPLLLSFNRLGHFYRRWYAVFPAILAMALFFLPWDIWFTHNKIWGFNKDYLIGLDIVNLPLEEWLFFLCVPYACLFLYDQLVILNTKNILKPIDRYLDYFILGIAASFLVKGFGGYYTTFLTLSVIVFILIKLNLKSPNNGIFYLSYIIILLPFSVVNGILTGYITDEPIVWYNNAENLGIRFFTIPIEDFLYYYLIFGMCYTVFEAIKKGRIASTS
jgi:lycopene cyclase domain-containing protein